MLVFVEGREDEHADAVELSVCDDGPGRCQPVHDGHANVHQHDVGAKLAHAGPAAAAIGRVSDHLDVAVALGERAESGAHELLVVDDHDADRGGIAQEATGSHPSLRARCVGIHFIPLAWVFAQPIYAVAGVLLAALAVVIGRMPETPAARSFWCGLFAAPVLLAVGVVCAGAGFAALDG